MKTDSTFSLKKKPQNIYNSSNNFHIQGSNFYTNSRYDRNIIGNGNGSMLLNRNHRVERIRPNWNDRSNAANSTYNWHRQDNGNFSHNWREGNVDGFQVAGSSNRVNNNWRDPDNRVPIWNNRNERISRRSRSPGFVPQIINDRIPRSRSPIQDRNKRNDRIPRSRSPNPDWDKRNDRIPRSKR